MSDSIRLALWFGTQPRAEILPRLLAAASALPGDAVSRGVSGCSVVALDWGEPPLLEERSREGMPLAEAADHLREFISDDCACELEMSWLLWTYDRRAWKQQPHPLRLSGFGVAFDEGVAQRDGHLVIDFGLDETFLAELAPWTAETRQRMQENILLLLAYVRKLERELRPQRRQLAGEAVTDWTQKLAARLETAGAISADTHGAPVQ